MKPGCVSESLSKQGWRYEIACHTQVCMHCHSKNVLLFDQNTASESEQQGTNQCDLITNLHARYKYKANKYSCKTFNRVAFLFLIHICVLHTIKVDSLHVCILTIIIP